MRNLSYIAGDLVAPVTKGHQIIAHVCNEMGIWTGETAGAIARKWPQSKQAYLRSYRHRIRSEFCMGSVQFVNATRVHVDRLVRIANMVAQPDVVRPVRYRALRKCLIAVARKAIKIGASVHMPKLQDNQTDSWPDIELIIYNTLCTASLSVYIYDPEPSKGEQLFGSVIRDRIFR